MRSEAGKRPSSKLSGPLPNNWMRFKACWKRVNVTGERPGRSMVERRPHQLQTRSTQVGYLLSLGILTLIFLCRSSFSPFPSGCGPHPSGFSLSGCRLPRCSERWSSRMPLYAVNAAVHSPASIHENTSQPVAPRAETYVRFSGGPSLSHSPISPRGEERHLRSLPQSQMSPDIQAHL